MVMAIDDYTFGRIVVDGRAFGSDCLIIGGEVVPHWRRGHGHKLGPEDLDRVIEAAPAILVVGTGASGMMRISDRTRRLLRENNIELEAFETGAAVARFNELCESGASVAAALHVTC